LPPPLILTATPSAVRRRYDLYRLPTKRDDWNPNAVKVRFNLPNTYPQYSDLRINYHCDRSIWWDELKVLQTAAVTAVRPDLSTESARLDAAKAARARGRAARDQAKAAGERVHRISVHGHWVYGP
jgi:hypothetical protein